MWEHQPILGSVLATAVASFAVIRFAGRYDFISMDGKEDELRRWIADRGLTASDQVEYAGYDPPMTPPALRRNEVLIRLNDEDVDNGREDRAF